MTKLEEIKKAWNIKPSENICKPCRSWADIDWFIQRVDKLESAIVGWNIAQRVWQARIKELEEGLKDATDGLEASGYYFDHPSLVRLRKLIEKGGEIGTTKIK